MIYWYNVFCCYYEEMKCEDGVQTDQRGWSSQRSRGSEAEGKGILMQSLIYFSIMTICLEVSV